MTETTSVLLQERVEDILILTLNRIEKHNALSSELNHRIGTAVQNAEADGIRCIIITGAGPKAFCAGGDMLEMSGINKEADDLPPPRERLDGAVAISKTPLPVIAAVNGYCYGGGVRLAICCDIRLASDTSSYRFPGAEYGLVVGAATLPRLVGAAKAKEWILTTRRIDAQEARDEGLVNQLFAPDELMPAAMDMARQIAANSPIAVRLSKEVIDLATLDGDAMKLENDSNRKLRGSDEQRKRFNAATTRVTGKKPQD
ncbi:MAG: enoyl-CoA hydratase/isomerase family protein [Pseudomonadales bacterium]|nr:enoyl-CoA hydratase/isomerase family protein [Pseudomonadales bacterium]